MTEIKKYDPDNIFAKIIRGDMPCVKIYEDADILAFMDIFPQSDGHALVIHKRTRATAIFDILPDDLKDLIEGVQKVARGIEKALRPDGVRIAQFNGAEAGQTVYHIHFHIIPIYAGRALGGHAHGKGADTARLAGMAAKIAAAI